MVLDQGCEVTSRAEPRSANKEWPSSPDNLQISATHGVSSNSSKSMRADQTGRARYVNANAQKTVRPGCLHGYLNRSMV